MNATVMVGVPLRVDPAEVEAFVAYLGPAVPPASDLAARLAAAMAEVSRLAEPGVLYRALAVRDVGADHLDVQDGVRLEIPGIGAHWGAVAEVVAGVVTVGARVDAAVRERRAQGDAAFAWLLNAAASAAVECLAEWLNDDLCRQGVAASWRVTNRISPGYAGWALEEHAALLALLPLPAIGVTLGPGGAMSPAKTISLLVGRGPAARVDHYFVQCRRCWVSACPWRRMPAVASVHA